ncbi:Mitochondrial inner membrane organizing system protein 1, partial [Leucoagaricus sp. SymC.cos]
RIVSDIVYRGVGFSVGIVASVIFFRRRTWPIALSTGFGAGAAYADCDRSFNPARIPGTRVLSENETAALQGKKTD